MRYTLWSRGTLVGYTDLDIHTITPTMRQGFVVPTEEGMPILADATGVWRAMAEIKRGIRARGQRVAGDDALFLAAVSRREALELELRDEKGAVTDYSIRVNDLFAIDDGIVDEMCDTEEEEEADFQVQLSALSGEARDQALAERAELKAEIEEIVTEVLTDRAEAKTFGSSWPPPEPEDPRWGTMQYLIQAIENSSEPD